MSAVNRRRAILSGLFIGAGLTWPGNWSLLAVDQALAADPEQPLQRFPRMMQDFLLDKVKQAHSASVRLKAELKSKADAEAYVTDVRQRIAQAFGPMPEKTPLNARTTGVVERDQYRIENVIFESRPNFPVTANLYLPKVDQPAPGVVGSCGHSVNGKAAEAYQAFAQGLARQGYVCLIFDPIGQGERLQYPIGPDKSRIGVGVQEHLHAGNQQFLIGEFFGSWRAWDGIRALDYLLSRPEVDPHQVGITGNSGGGTMTTWLCGVEARWTMAAPSCFVTTFLHNVENEIPADTEQCPPRVLALGLEHEDFLAALAPKPIMILAKERDYFDARGSEEAYHRLKQLYTLLGHPENIKLHIGPTEHGYSIENREAMYGHFNAVTKRSPTSREPALTIEKDETLWCTKTGQVQELNPATVFSFTSAKANQLQAERGQPRGEDLVKRLKHLLRLPDPYPNDPPHFRILRSLGDRKYPRRAATTYAIETEDQALAICYMLTDQTHYSRPPRVGRAARLYIAHRSSDDELRREGWLREIIASDPQLPTFAVDVRGIGESMPNTCGAKTFDSSYGCDYFYAIHGIMLDRPYLGQKTLDVLRVLDWLAAYGYDQIELIGHGWGATPATFAGLLSSHVRSVRLHQRLESFHSLATTEEYEMPLANLLPGVLQHLDLPDCYAELGPRLLS